MTELTRLELGAGALLDCDDALPTGLARFVPRAEGALVVAWVAEALVVGADLSALGGLIGLMPCLRSEARFCFGWMPLAPGTDRLTGLLVSPAAFGGTDFRTCALSLTTLPFASFDSVESG